MPAQGIEDIIRLRSRVRQRLQENGEVVGSDEQFFEDDKHAQQLRDLYTEKSGILDLEADSEVDLSSYAYQEWANATKDSPTLKKKIEALPDVVYSSRRYEGSRERPEGVITYVKSSDDTDALVWLDKEAKLSPSPNWLFCARPNVNRIHRQSRAISCTTTWYWLACK